jgi:hypothetical protein
MTNEQAAEIYAAAHNAAQEKTHVEHGTGWQQADQQKARHIQLGWHAAGALAVAQAAIAAEVAKA